jgi:phosphatidylserine decarboxylase
MYRTLLYKESLYIGLFFTFLTIYLFIIKNKYKIIPFIILIILMIFYRYKNYTTEYDDNMIVSPAEGKITNIMALDNNRVLVSIFLSVFNNHTQLYPVNGTVIKRVYDDTGQFNIVIDRYKSRNNEKKIHTIRMNNNNIVEVIQIAGFLPRRIASSDVVPLDVKAGEYLGMIKFGSRVDLIFLGDINKLLVTLNDNIKLGDIIYEY